MKQISMRILFLSMVFMLVFSGCSTELRLAKQFVSQRGAIKAAVYFPEEAQVTLVQNEEGVYSQVLDSLDQNAFLDIMYAAYAQEMGRYGVEVYVPEDADAVVTDSTHWMILLSKMEIQGLFTNYVDQLFDLVDEYEFTFPLNTVNVASWFDISDGEWLPTQYYEYNLTEEFKSHVSFKGKEGPQYHYDITPLKTEDLYDYSVFLAKQYAAFTHSCMMNRYVRQEMGKAGLEPRFKMRWNPVEETFYYQEEEEGFVELGNKE